MKPLSMGVDFFSERGRPVVRRPGAAALLTLAAVIGSSWSSAQESPDCHSLLGHMVPSDRATVERGRFWRRRNPQPTPRCSVAPETVALRIDWSPVTTPDPTHIVELLASELPAALSNTHRFVVHPIGLEPLGLSTAGSQPTQDLDWLPVPEGSGLPPQLECCVTILQVALTPPLEITARVELTCPLSTRPPLRLQGTWRPPATLTTVAPTRSGRWRPIHSRVEDFQPESTLLSVSPREFSKYVAREMAASLADQWRFADSLPIVTESGWSVPPESVTTP